ncbi:hypothetical protein NDU88_003748 [Pleurodeles waltl]|uniref:Reverse transcriptase domain-containing protein n=1 Tax=Pleurodeles waltl TaxID=8319 RepID=A0AAV7PAG5_PLEWA|nr:hypothetical protein NDU88_003748 [Pleurodeles waltl]
MTVVNAPAMLGIEELDIHLNDVILAIKGSLPDKAPGPDGVPADLFKYNIDLWAPILENGFRAVSTSVLPPAWSSAIIVPIFKKGDHSDPACYRPISLIDATAKIFGRILLAHLEAWALDNNIISKSQFGFRNAVGTAEQCLNLHLIREK